jgi:hypothetical protein
MVQALQRVDRKMDGAQERGQGRSFNGEIETKLLRQIEDVSVKLTECSSKLSSPQGMGGYGPREMMPESPQGKSQPGQFSDDKLKAFNDTLKRELGQLVGQAINQMGASVDTALRNALGGVEERMVDIRRMNMTVMDTITGIQERTERTSDMACEKMQSLEHIHPERICAGITMKFEQTMQVAVSNQVQRMQREIEESMFGTGPLNFGSGTAGSDSGRSESHGHPGQAFSSGNYGTIGSRIAELCRSMDLTTERLNNGAMRLEGCAGSGGSESMHELLNKEFQAVQQISEQLVTMSTQMDQRGSDLNSGLDRYQENLSQQIQQMSTRVAEGMQKFELAIGKILRSLPSGPSSSPK